MLYLEAMKLAFPKDRPTQIGWALGIFFTVVMVYWWFDSLFPGTELSFTAMFWKIAASLATVAISLYLMHINYD